jgi:hypothetical protein
VGGTLWGAAVVPEVLALARLVISQVLQQLLRSVLASAVMMVGINAVVQAIEFLKGDRTSTTAAVCYSFPVFAGSGWFGRGAGGVFARSTRPRRRGGRMVA